MLSEYLGSLGDHRRQAKRVERLRLHLPLHRLPLRQLRFDLLFKRAWISAGYPGDIGSGWKCGLYRDRRLGFVPAPEEQRAQESEHDQSADASAYHQQRVAVKLDRAELALEPAKFEAASIKPATPDNEMTGLLYTGGSMMRAGGTLREL